MTGQNQQKGKTQISLAICHVWSESLQSIQRLIFMHKDILNLLLYLRFSYGPGLSHLWNVHIQKDKNARASTWQCKWHQGIFCPPLGAEFRPHSQSKLATFPQYHVCLFFPIKKNKKKNFFYFLLFFKTTTTYKKQ